MSIVLLYERHSESTQKNGFFGKGAMPARVSEYLNRTTKATLLLNLFYDQFSFASD
jgi:hypothetical protein